jgi:non-specific serine/threonine protein kinase/serine/threonine-protein kinase
LVHNLAVFNMAEESSIFESKPENVKRLFQYVFEEPAAEDHAPMVTSIDTIAEKPGGRIDCYLLQSVLGEGGMGIVFLAEQEEPVKRQVALKVIKPGMDSKRVIARFKAERQTLALMEHSHIARVYDAGLTLSGRPYFVMEYVQGLPITEYCDQHKLTIKERLNLFLKVCNAVQHAHQKGIIHRDIKPSNILVSVQDDQAVPKIIDFGVAKAISQPLTEQTLATMDSQLLGTPEYMSPEQADIASEDIDTRSDIYSLGVLLYVLLTGILPFDSDTLREGGIDHIRKVIRKTDPKTPSTRLSNLGEDAKRIAEKRKTEVKLLARYLKKELEWIPLKAMRKERAERYESASELAEDIRNYLTGNPLIAGQPSKVYQLKKFVRRHKSLVTGITAVIVVLIAGIIVSTVFAVYADRESKVSQAVVDFLTKDVLMSADPVRAKRWEITLSEVLDVASENLKTKFSNEPLVEASIRHTLGSTYLSLGKYPAAESHIENADRIRRVELGQEHPDTLATTASLGLLRLRQSKYEEAERLCTTAVEGRRRVLGPEHSETLSSMCNLAVVYWYQQRNTEAETLFSEVVKLGSRTLGEEHPDTLAALKGVAWTYVRQARHAEAQQLFESLYKTCFDILGEEHNSTQAIMNGLVVAYMQVNRYEEAESFGLRCLELRRQTLGDEHPETLEAMGLLASVYTGQGRSEEAEQLYKTVQETQCRLGMQDSRALGQLLGLAKLYIEQSRYGEAEPLLLQAYQRKENLFGREHSSTINMLNQLVSLYEAWDKPEKTEEWRAKLPQTEVVEE